MRKLWKTHGQNLLCAGACAVLLALTAACLWPAVRAYYGGFCRAEADCRMKHVTVADLERLAGQEKDGMAGLADLAGWRYEAAGEAVDPATSRRAETGVICAYGSPDLIFPVRTIDGSCGQVLDADDCVVTKGLSDALCGAVDISGSLLEYQGRTYRVMAVLDKKEALLILPADEGRIERAAFLFRGRGRADERLKTLGF